MAENTDSAKLSLVDLLRRSAAEFVEETALAFQGRSTTYRSFDAQTDRVAAFLASQGISKGDRVALYCPNSDHFAVAYFGILKAGAVVVPVNLLLTPQQIAHILNDSKISALIYHAGFATAVSVLRPSVKSLRCCIVIDGEKGPDRDTAWSAALQFDAGTTPSPLLDPAEDLAAIIYTSGTTGQPKGAMLTHRNLAANSVSVAQALHLRPAAERILVVLPMFHSFAGTVGLLMPLLNGATIVVMPRFDPQQVADTIAAEQATIFLGVPTMYSLLLALPEAASRQLNSLRFCISGGAALPVAVMEQFERKFGVLIYEGDGPTECGPVTSVNPIDGLRKPGSVGLPLPDVEMRILDAEGDEQADGEIGEICVRGANVMKGYWNNPEETKKAFFGEWFRTGDLGYRDADGYFFIVDRIKDLVIYNGMNVYPRVVEDVLYQMPAVREAAVIGEPHALHGEIPVAYIALNKGQELTADEVAAYCSEHLGRHEVPRKVYFADDLPKSGTGKILKRALRSDGERERGVILDRPPPAAH